MMKKSQRFCMATCGITLVMLLLVGGMVFVIDPFFHYHKPWFGMQPTVNNEVYQNPGIAEHFDYDSVITGSSMTENFRASWFDEAFGCTTVKLPYGGGQSKNFNIIFQKIFQHGEIKNVFYGLDIFALQADPFTTRTELPEYLYDDNIFNDTKYIFNKSVLFGQTPKTVRDFIEHNHFNLDEAYVWEKNYTFSKKTVLLQKRSGIIEHEPDISMALNRCNQNLQNIMPHILENPETQFYIFFPPYSIIFWDATIRAGTLEETIASLEYAMETLLQYPNVKLFFFQNEESIVTNLDHYKDYTHYGPWINQYILESFQTEQHLMTQENYQEELGKMYQLAIGFDYDALFAYDSSAH